MKTIQFPLSKEDARALCVGEEVLFSGTIVTARDAAHKILVEENPDFIRSYLFGGAVYHCGPVMVKRNDKWVTTAAGPTTSIREEPYEASVIKEYGVRAVIGKGGMGRRTLEALQHFGAVYLHTVGGAAVSIADRIQYVENVFLLEELGVPEAFWIMRVDGIKAVVTMDSAGNSLHDKVLKESLNCRNRLLGL